MKPMSNRTPMRSTSAAPEKDKVQTVVNEMLRRFKNTSREFPVSIIDDILKAYSEDLQRGGGFPKLWIKEALRAATTGYGRMIQGELKGTGKVNRPEHMGRIARRHKHLLGKGSWFRKTGGDPNQESTSLGIKGRQSKNKKPTGAKPETVLFVPHTPGGALKKILQQVDGQVMGDNPYGRVKVVETLGDNMVNALSNRAPWKSEPCGRPNCLPCKTKAGSCRARNITYGIECLNCKTEGNRAVYWGESHRTWYDRAKEHGKAIETGDTKYGIVKHHQAKHRDLEPKFAFKLDRSWKSSLQRQIAESILIQETPLESLINSKSEWGSYSIPRLTVESEQERQRQETDTRDNIEIRRQSQTTGDRPTKRPRVTTEEAIQTEVPRRQGAQEHQGPHRPQRQQTVFENAQADIRYRNVNTLKESYDRAKLNLNKKRQTEKNRDLPGTHDPR